MSDFFVFLNVLAPQAVFWHRLYACNYDQQISSAHSQQKTTSTFSSHASVSICETQCVVCKKSPEPNSDKQSRAVLPWASVGWTAGPSRSPCPALPWRRCVLPVDCARRCVRPGWAKVPPHGCAVRGWHRPTAPNGPRYGSAANDRGMRLIFIICRIW